MQNQQPKPDSKKYTDLISEIDNGVIKIPKFQRDFVWGIDKTAKLLDSILKGYPIGTFILWQTDERINEIKNIGNLALRETPEGTQVQYVLDGQQRITSLYAAYLGAKIQKIGEKKQTDYSNICVNLDDSIDFDDDQVITAEPTGIINVSLSDVLNFMDKMTSLQEQLSPENFKKVHAYSQAFNTYDFSTVLLRRDDIDSAIEVFTRINTGGQTLTLFEIMSAKTYDESKNFDMQAKWEKFVKELSEIKYEGVSNTIVLNTLSLVLSRTKECKRKTILSLKKQSVIETWDQAVSALTDSIHYFRTVYRIPVSKLLPYDALLVPFAYFFYHNNGSPNAEQGRLLQEFFWRISLSYRYSSSTESKLAQDIKRIDLILKGVRPTYEDINVLLESPQTLIDMNFGAGNSYCKAVLCLLASAEPQNFNDNSKVLLDNSWLKMAHSKNFHHFFPKSFLRKQKQLNENSLMNITLVSDELNKRKIGSKGPSTYVTGFANDNPEIDNALETHFIRYQNFGIESDDYEVFLRERANLIFNALQTRLEPVRTKIQISECQKLISKGESSLVEFKSTLRWDVKRSELNKKLEFHGVARTIAAFMNSNGGSLIIGVDDDRNILGLELDIQTLKKQNLDGFELKLVEVIRNYIGSEYSSHIKISFEKIEGKEICWIQVSKSSSPIFVKFEGQEHFFNRAGASTQSLSRAEQSIYEREHWG